MPRKRTSKLQTDGFAARRAEIVDIAAHLFAENGYAGTGIAQIGDAVKLARGALYYYIDSKETLLNEIHDRVMDPLLATAEQVVATNASAEVRLRLVSEELLTQIIERREHVWVFLHEYRALRDERLAHFRKRRRKFEDFISQLLDEGRKDGAFEFEDVRLVTLSFLNLHNYTYQWVDVEGRLGARELSALYCSIFFHGIAAPGEE
ncbi:MAG: TetR/AcrR family transcriptional regulator [Actinomycetota bacterium]|nr:TetR/AcrR family transcriptional regulator [Actinomycetota bacterium]